MSDQDESITFGQFRQIGKEQQFVQPNSVRRLFIKFFGPLGVNARIRSARMINAICRLKLPPGAQILDAGCGHAYTIFWLARQYRSYLFTGLEIDNKLISDGQYIAQKLGLQNVRFIQTSAPEIAEQGLYHLIFSMDVLEHIVDDIATLNNFHRALQPGGKLLLHLPRRHQDAWRFLPSFRSYTTPDHVRDEYTADEIYDKLTQTGFQVDYIKYGYSRWGELAFEANYLFWNSPVLRVSTALLLHPLSTWLAYMDIRRDHCDGNSILSLSHSLPDSEFK